MCFMTFIVSQTGYSINRAVKCHYSRLQFVWLLLGVSKKLLKISQSKDREKLQKWLRSIKKHIYWTAASSSSGQERVAKWTSILNHVQDIHTHEDPVFSRCLHPRRTTRDKSKWLRAGVFTLFAVSM